MIKRTATALALTALTALPAAAETTFTVLGSGGGPIVSAERSQPANLLQVNGRNIVVDAGDGLSIRLAAKRVRMGDIDDVLLSHLHFDHAGGLLAVLGLRFQTNPAKPVMIYGPPGTAALINGIVEGMGPAMEAAYGMEDAEIMTPEQLVQVREIRDGDTLELGDVTVTVAKNAHYSFPDGSDLEDKYESLSFRFDTPDRSIVYTGDTGWSEEVIALAKDADLLVSELIDLPAVMENVRRSAPEHLLEEIEWHLAEHHVSPEQVGRMAAEAGVSSVVATHLVAGAHITQEQTEGWIEQIRAGFDGEIAIAEDLQDF
ncbi:MULTISPECIES: MBL fold metallo-hydrolase [unclassified Halomonas]|uniref:MBL fold metallo-hydrolase n=1 Tax=unclassified Halomonas TaxID=2609666 RepID=UPI0021E50EBE|nr:MULTISPECIES: MBL fold metallo-hydrolase [unclassified Halomonas]UYG00523.1 MBL fold metallo-hydrolase [Halomonas sp. GD1P12]WNL38402.1 MBL fold metallo-hydrolase [Halomonas sp. PAMB 3232]WNL41702.1 MBL fold metallo-hydrolase [Halomonas sp. PAMB 3264]